MINRREGHFQGHGGVELFFQTWMTPQNNETLVITHGMAEHSECYADTADVLVKLGWNICAWDLRGHGQSSGKRGFVEDFRFFSLDLAAFLNFLRTSDRLKENFGLIGHSMGGLITARHLIDGDKTCPRPRAVALSSPALGIAVEVPAIKDFAARVLKRFAPTVTMSNEINYDQLTRDPERLKAYPHDPLRHDKASPELYLGMVANMVYVLANAERIHLPILVQAAGRDKIVDLQAEKKFFPLIGSTDKKFIEYEESYHEIFNDLDRAQVFKDLDAFLAPRIRSAR